MLTKDPMNCFMGKYLLVSEDIEAEASRQFWKSESTDRGGVDNEVWGRLWRETSLEKWIWT